MKPKIRILLLVVVFLGTISEIYAQRPSFNKSKDILIACFDIKPDPDDIHAAAALGSMLVHPDLNGVNYFAVAGAYGNQNGSYLESNSLFNMAFGNNWADAHSNRSAAIAAITNKVTPILQNGGKVWIQEGGQSDVTADWLMPLINANNGITSAITKNNVIVVQHDDKFNEGQANQSKLNNVKANTRYFLLDDGNAGWNESWGDHGPWSTPMYRNRSNTFVDNAKTSPNAVAKKLWTEADRIFNNYFPNGFPHDWSFFFTDGVDYSDCVENWWIFEIGSKADTHQKFWTRYVMNTDSSDGNPDPDPTPCTGKTYEEKNGVVAVEAEDFVKQTKTENREWFVIGQATNTPTPDPDPSHAGSASGGKYLELLPDTRVTHGDPLTEGVNFTNTPGKAAVVDYKIKFNSPGKYFVWVRAFSTGTEDNGVHVGINGTWPASGARMQWCEGKNAWTWASKQRTNAQHCGVQQLIFIDVPSAGVHTISFSMREDGFEMDKFIMSKVYTAPVGAGAAPVLADCGDTGGGSCSTNTQIGNLRSTGSTETSITADWADVSGANTYELRAWPKGQFTGSINTPAATSFASGSSSPVTISGLTKGTEYTLVLRALCSSGVATQLSQVNASTSGGAVANCNTAPSNVTASGATDTSVTVSYANTAGDTRTFELRAFPQGTFNGDINAPNAGYAGGGAGSTSVTMNNLDAGTSYDFVLRALCGPGIPASPVATIVGTTTGGNTPVADCTVAPSGFTQTGSTTTSATFTFNNTSNDTRSFELRPYAPGTFTGNVSVGALGYASVPAGSTSISIGNLQPGTSYDFVFRAICTGSPASPPVVLSGSTGGASVPQTATLSPVEDAFVQGTSGANQSLLRVQQGYRTAYLKFDVSSINGPITNASLKLTVDEDFGNGNIQIFNASSNNWTESTINSSNAPGNGSVLGNLNQSFAKQTAYTFDLSNMTVSGNFLSLVVTHTGNNDVSFKSSESASGTPQLVVNYNAPASAAARLNNNKALVNKMVVFPNPARNTLQVQGISKDDVVTITDLSGRTVLKEITTKQSSLQLDISSLQNGLYFVMIKNQNKKTALRFTKI